MPYDMRASSERIKIEGTWPIDMYCLNASQSSVEYYYYADMNQNVIGYSLSNAGTVQSTEIEYTGLPITRNEITSNVEGEITGVDITIPNVDRSLESLIHSKRYFRGCEVYMMTGFAKHLPSGGTATYIGNSPDHNAIMKEKFYIDSVTSNQEAVTFHCRSKFDINNITLPNRTYSRHCAWAMGIANGYRGSQCDVSGSISATTFPTCDGTLEQCRERNNSRRFGGFPSIPRESVFISI